MDYGVLECLNMSVFTWFTNVGLIETENLEFIDCFPSGLFIISVSVLRLVMLDFNCMHRIIATGHLQHFNTAPYDILFWIFVHHIYLPHLYHRYICSQHQFTPALSSVCFTKSGTIQMIFAGSCNLCSSFSTLEACAVVLLGK